MESNFPKVTGIAPEENVERLEQARLSSRIANLFLLHRVTYTGEANPKQVKRNRAKNKLARRQRRVNRLRENSQSATPSRFPGLARRKPHRVPQIQRSK